MQRTFNYQSDVLSEREGSDLCIEVTVDISIDVSTDHEVTASVDAIYDSLTGDDISECPALVAEVNKQVDLELETYFEDILKDWQAHQIDAHASYLMSVLEEGPWDQ
jgi:hypothetical protein